MSRGLRDVVILADDLSGAAETASMLAAGAPAGVRVLLAGDGHSHAVILPGSAPEPGPVAVDTDTRYATPDTAFRVVAGILSSVPADRLLVKKVDSLLRGNLAAELRSVTESGRTVLFAPALPRMNRVVRGGRLHVDGTPLADTAAWRRESTTPPATVLDALRGIGAETVPLDVVRRESRLTEAVRRADRGTVLVCDAETDSDLDRIAAAALQASDSDHDVALAGSAAATAALGRLFGVPVDSELPEGAMSIDGRVVFVVGTAEPRARTQVDALRARGAHVLALDPAELLADAIPGETSTAVRAALTAPVSVVTTGAGAVDPGAGRVLAERLAGVVAASVPDAPPALLVLTGGETARRVLDALGVRRLTVRGIINAHAALSATEAGTAIVTRPGSFGADDDFLRILQRVSPAAYATLT